MLEQKDYEIELHMYRPDGKDYRDDKLQKMLVNGEPFYDVDEHWGKSIAAWMNEMGITFKGYSQGSIKARLDREGFSFSYYEQSWTDAENYVRTYVIRPMLPVQMRFEVRSRVIRLAAQIVSVCANDETEDGELAAQVRACIRQMLAETDAMDLDQRMISVSGAPFNLKDRVVHKNLGLGTVKSIKKSNGDYEVEVDFDQHGMRRLLAKVADMKLVLDGKEAA